MQTPQEDLQSIPKKEMASVEIDQAINTIEKYGLTKEQSNRLLKAIINQDKDLPPNIKREIIRQVKSLWQKEAREIELCLLRKHLDEQIYQDTINTDSVYRYIESRINSLK